MNKTVAKVVSLFPETRGGKHECLFDDNGSTPEQCWKLSSSLRNNKQCQDRLCTSRWRVCPACIQLDTVSENSRVVNPDASLCKWHVDNGEKSIPGSVDSKGDRKPPSRPVAQAKKTERLTVVDKKGQPPVTGVRVALSVDGLMAQKNVSGKMAELKKRIGRALKTAGPSINAPVDRIRRCEGQPREYFSEEELIAVGMSIKEGAQVIAIYVRKVSGDPKHDYEIIDGERRWRGCKKVGHPTIQIIVLNVDEKTQYLISVIANFGREPNTDLEAARALQRIIEDEGLSVPEAATLFSKPVQWAYNRLKLLRLDPDVQALLSPKLDREKRISFTVACILAGYPDKGFQKRMAKDIVKRSLGLHKATAHIKEQAEHLGKRSERQHEWRPGREYDALRHFISGTFDRLDHFLGLSGDSFRATLRTSLTLRTDVGNLEKVLLRGERLLKKMKDFQP